MRRVEVTTKGAGKVEYMVNWAHNVRVTISGHLIIAPIEGEAKVFNPGKWGPLWIGPEEEVCGRG